MFQHFGPQHWWPGDSPLEIVIGAVLTQNTNWANVERAIANLRQRRLIDIRRLLAIDPAGLAELIRPAGYFTVKTRRLRNLLTFIDEQFDADLSACFDQPLDTLRNQLLAVNGVGPETADDIVLYAAEKPSFVVDAYTRRIFTRHGLLTDAHDYTATKAFFEAALPADVELFKEYHALIVACAKDFCRKSSPRCDTCPLNRFPHTI